MPDDIGAAAAANNGPRAAIVRSFAGARRAETFIAARLIECTAIFGRPGANYARTAHISKHLLVCVRACLQRADRTFQF